MSIASVIGYGTLAFAVAPVGGYIPGQTLNPTCTPGSTDCSVASAWSIDTVNELISNNFNNITIAGNTELLGNTTSLNEFSGSRFGIIQNGPSTTLGTSAFENGLNLRFIDDQKSAGIFMGDLSGLLPGNTNTIYINNTNDATGDSAYAFFNADGSLMLAAQDANKHSNINVFKQGFRLRHAGGPDSSPTGDWHSRIDIEDNRVLSTFQRGGGTDPGVTLTTWTETQLDENGFAIKGIDDSGLNQAFLVKNNTGLQALRVMNDGAVRIGALAGGICPLEVDVTGTIICSTPSDANLKHDITDLSYGLDTIMKLRPVSYQYNDAKYGSGNQIGFVAQEVQEVIPEVVFRSQGHLGINYALLTSVNTKAIQELELRLTALEGVAQSVNSSGLSLIRNWLADATNGITEIIAGKISTHELCIDGQCLTKDDVQQLLILKNQLQNTESIPPSSASTPVETPSPADVLPEVVLTTESSTEITPDEGVTPDATPETGTSSDTVAN